MSLTPGNKVIFLNEKGGGVIVSIKNKKTAIVLSDEGFELPYPIDQLVLTDIPEVKAAEPEPVEEIAEESMEDINLDEIDTTQFFKGKEYTSGNKKSKRHAHRTGALEREVDLHISELLEDTWGITNGQMLVLQLACFHRELDEARLGNIRKIIFIHGIGNGRLKQEIRRLLKEEEGIQFYDAAYSKYGFGATEVVILGR